MKCCYLVIVNMVKVIEDISIANIMIFGYLSNCIYIKILILFIQLIYNGNDFSRC